MSGMTYFPVENKSWVRMIDDKMKGHTIMNCMSKGAFLL